MMPLLPNATAMLPLREGNHLPWTPMRGGSFLSCARVPYRIRRDSMSVPDIVRHLFENFGARYLLNRTDEISNNVMGKRGMLYRAFLYAQINHVSGDYFEFGVYRGQSFLMAHRMKRRFRMDQMKLWAFDSFAGLPEIDDAYDSTWSRGEYACSLDEFRRILARGGVRTNEYEVVAGYYDRSLNEDLHGKLAGHRASVVYVDCDLYSSTVAVLNFVKRYLDNGTIVCFDDFYHYRANPHQGEQRALSEFLHHNTMFTFIPWTDYSPVGKSFIVRVQVNEHASSDHLEAD